jgi:hypothetical protein
MSREFLQLDENLFVLPSEVAAVKRSSLEDEKCVVYLKGHSALEGFVVDMDAESCIEEIEQDLADED